MIAATAGIVPVTVACSRAQPARTRGDLTKVTYATGYNTTPREEYAQVAKARGEFSRVGLDVDIAPGQPSDSNLKLLESGKVDFASIDFVSAARAYHTHRGDFRIVAAVQDSTLVSLMTLAGSGVSVPADLMGKTVGIGAGAASQTLFPTYARLAGFDPRKVRIQNFDTAQLPLMLAAGRLSAIGAYSIDGPTISRTAHGRTATPLPYAKYLTDLYGTVLVTTVALATNRSSTVRNFATALMAGVRYAVDHPQDAGRMIRAAVAADDATVTAQIMSAMRPYVRDGRLDATRVMRGIAVLEAAGLVAQGSLEPDQLVAFDLMPKAVAA